MTKRRPARAVVAVVGLVAACCALSMLGARGMRTQIKLGAQATVKTVTPCSTYNKMHTLGNGNCIECTELKFERQSDPQDVVMVDDPHSGDVFPLTKPAVPGIHKKKASTLTCKWCPETQTCGHPLDYRASCGPFDADGRSMGWVDKARCFDRLIVNRDIIDQMDADDYPAVRLKPVADQDKWFMNETKISKRRVDVASRETIWLHNHDTINNCFGKCQQPGQTSSCSGLNEKIMPEQASAAMELGSKRPKPHPCSREVPTDAMVPMKVWGQFKSSSPVWRMCKLIPCRPLSDPGTQRNNSYVPEGTGIDKMLTSAQQREVSP